MEQQRASHRGSAHHHAAIRIPLRRRGMKAPLTMSDLYSSEMNMSGAPLRISLIAAVTRSNGLGSGGGLPWTLPKEMSHFRRCTTVLPPRSSSSSHGANFTSPSTSPAKDQRMNAVIMGRNTWESIPEKFRPLKGRWNVVVSRSMAASQLGASGQKGSNGGPAQTLLANSLKGALDHLSKLQSLHLLGRTFMIGGAQLYAQAMLTLPQHSSTASNDHHASPFVLDTLLITRLKSDLNCDVHLPEFRSDDQIRLDEKGTRDDSSTVISDSVGQQESKSRGRWKRATHEQFNEWLGATEKDLLPAGAVEEKGLEYELQMWLPA
ncbi:dihydrofolate reductase [Ceraceosorus bombacis]|uniref:Dihydrofolate reductase n=1 Tax=Ceraceosorus bombacis TaxID=401625 RepID=A0A0P1B8P3_9BASI|nr:dihydrofolate reductase [Ceraceosorus bombacis]